MTGLEIDGLCSANGVAPSIPVGKALLQGRAGLRLYKAKPKDTLIEEGVQPASFQFRSLPELEAMSASKLKLLVLELQQGGRGKFLPIVPAHRDGLILWILKAQAIKPPASKPAAGFPTELEKSTDQGISSGRLLHGASLWKGDADGLPGHKVRPQTPESLVLESFKEARRHRVQAAQRGLSGHDVVLPR